MANSEIHLILASQSPRRRQLLQDAGYSFTVVTRREALEAGIALDAEEVEEENPRFHPDPVQLVIQNALAKARSTFGIFSGHPDFRDKISQNFPGKRMIIVGCDTVAVCAGEILGKPADQADAERMLRLLSGSDHSVLSGLALIDAATGGAQTLSVTTTLFMEELSEKLLQDYLAGGAWQGKAGAFGYQDGIAWLHRKSGSESNIVGLPMEALAELLERWPLT